MSDEYSYKVTPDEMAVLYTHLTTLGMGGPVAGNVTAADPGADDDDRQSVIAKMLDDIKERNHAEQGHPDA
jgi:hypothetical protein